MLNVAAGCLWQEVLWLVRRKRVGLYIAGTSFPNPLSVYNHHLDSWSLAREGPAAGSNIATGRTITASVPECVLGPRGLRPARPRVVKELCLNMHTQYTGQMGWVFGGPAGCSSNLRNISNCLPTAWCSH